VSAPARPRQSSKAEVEAFDTVCVRLGGFDPGLSFERVDGLLCAVAAGPRTLEAEEWLEPLFGDTFERTFADPADRAGALAALQARLSVLCDQLDAQALLDDPEFLRLDPLLEDWDDEARQRLVAEDGFSAEEAALMQPGSDWARGFLDGVDALPAHWDEPADEEAAALFEQAFHQIAALLMAPGGDAFRQHLAECWPKGPPTREELLFEAFMSVQDLRLYWVDFAPRPAQRRVEPAPGRNEPCPCGSGKKFKKCHGAAVS
jgi:uncharacterized protein